MGFLWFRYVKDMINQIQIVKLRSRSQVRSRSGPRSGSKGPRTKDQRPGPGLYIKFGLPPHGRGLAVKLRSSKVQGRSGSVYRSILIL